MIGSGVDFDSDPINVIFGVGEVAQTVNISVSCDEEVENLEAFDVSLTLTSNNPQVSVNLKKNKQKKTVRITDSTGQ